MSVQEKGKGAVKGEKEEKRRRCRYVKEKDYMYNSFYFFSTAIEKNQKKKKTSLQHKEKKKSTEKKEKKRIRNKNIYTKFG